MKELFGFHKQVKLGEPKLDMCSCDTCGWKGKVSACETDTDQDGWEMPVYTIHICPNCNDGTIDDYWPSTIKELGNEKEI